MTPVVDLEMHHPGPLAREDKLTSAESMTPNKHPVPHTLPWHLFQRIQTLRGYSFEYNINISNNKHYSYF